jgi:hypothetical protein
MLQTFWDTQHAKIQKKVYRISPFSTYLKEQKNDQTKSVI